MTAWDIKTVIVGICIVSSFFLAPLAAMAGDEKATGKQGVESVTIEQLRADLREAELQFNGCQYEREKHLQALQSIGKEQEAARKRYEEIKKEIGEREVKEKK